MAFVNLRDVIGNVETFATLGPDMLDALIQAGATMKYAPGGTIVEQGALGGGLHLFLEGGGTVVVSGEPVRSLGEGDYFGEMSLFDDSPRSATIIAGIAGAKTFTVSPVAFGAVLDASPSTARVLLRTMARRLREAEDRANLQEPHAD